MCVKSYAETINGIEVPPKPDEKANSITFEGVDSNQNEVRDDVERKIAEKWGNDPKLYQQTMEFAKLIQRMFVRYAFLYKRDGVDMKPDSQLNVLVDEFTKIACDIETAKKHHEWTDVANFSFEGENRGWGLMGIKSATEPIWRKNCKIIYDAEKN
jgi:hypothetical protein